MSTRRIFSLSTLSMLFVGLAIISSAHDAPFTSEITVTATGTEEEVDAVPLAVTVISEEEMINAQTPSVAEILRRVPGLNVVQSGGPGSVASVFTRGTESDHTLVMFDGVRLNSPYFGGFDVSQLATAGLKRIEIARGPSSALWGADAIGGAINLIPGAGTDGFEGNLVVEGGEGSWQRYQGTFAYGTDTFDVLASGLIRKGNGELANSDFDLGQAVVNAGFKWGLGSRLSVLFHGSETENGIPFSSPGTLTPLRRQTASEQTVAVPLHYQVSSRWLLEATISAVERDLNFSDPDDPWGFTWSRTKADTIQARLASSHSVGDHKVSLGAEWRQDEVDDDSVYGSNLESARYDMTSLFAQDVWQIVNNLTLVYGVRWDDTEQWGSEISPRVNLGWKVSDTVELRAGYGEAYRQPSIGELFYPYSGNLELKPETSDSTEVGLVWGGRTASKPRIQLTAFSTDIDDMIIFDYINNRMENIGQAEIDGLEASLDIVHSDTLQSSAQVTWLDTSDGLGNDLLRRPEWSGAYTIAGVVLPWLKSYAVVRYVGRRDDVDPVTFVTTRSDSFVTADLALAATVHDQLELTLRATNLFDEDYEEVLGYPAYGRRIIAGLRVGF